MAQTMQRIRWTNTDVTGISIVFFFFLKARLKAPVTRFHTIIIGRFSSGFYDGFNCLLVFIFLFFPVWNDYTF